MLILNFAHLLTHEHKAKHKKAIDKKACYSPFLGNYLGTNSAD
jgi:hypothetical protein